jgi:hypothetical protein
MKEESKQFIKDMIEQEGDMRWSPLPGKPGFMVAKRGTRVLLKAPKNRAKIMPQGGGS